MRPPPVGGPPAARPPRRPHHRRVVSEPLSADRLAALRQGHPRTSSPLPSFVPFALRLPEWTARSVKCTAAALLLLGGVAFFAIQHQQPTVARPSPDRLQQRVTVHQTVAVAQLSEGERQWQQSWRDLGFAPRTAPDDGAATVTERHIRDFSLDFFSLSGKKAIVTGGNRGLGQAYAVAMAKAGADLYIPTVADDGTTNELIEAEGRRCEIVTADLTVSGTPAEVVKGCVDTLGGVDIVVNNAGIGINVDDVREFDRSRWDPMVAVNLTAAFEMSHAVSSIFIEQGSGKIINVCSMFSFLGGQRSPAYAATKHGIAGLTKAYADELGPFGVQVNGIAPGYFATELTAETRKDPAYNKAVLDHIPAGEWGQVQDLMGACVFLASAASTYVNGHVLAVDGGYLVR